MKKALPLLAVLLALAATVLFTRRRVGGGAEVFSAARAADLAPAETVAFFQVVDLDRTLERCKQNELGAIVNEPNWQEMWETLSKFLATDPESAALFETLTTVQTMKPAGFFLAVTSLQEPGLPVIVGGFPYRGKKTEVEGAVRVLKERPFKSWAGAKSELSQHHGVEIETIAGTAWIAPAPAPVPVVRLRGTVRIVPTPAPFSPWVAAPPMRPPPPPPPRHQAVQLAFRDDWLFFATDRALLTGLLDRYLRRPDAPRGLAQDPAFVECRAHGPADADLVAWARWEPTGRGFADRLLNFSIPPEGGDGNPVRSVLYTCTMAGPQSRDRLYFLLTRPPRSTPLANRSARLTTPETYGCATINFDALLGEGHWIREQFWSGRPWMRQTEMQKWGKTELDELRAAFGPELILTLQGVQFGDWPQEIVALEIRDLAKARKFAEQLAEAEHATVQTLAGGMTRWSWPSSRRHSFLSPMVLTKTHLIFGANRAIAMNAVERLAATGPEPQPTLQSNPDYATASGTPAPDGMHLYFDVPKYFARSDGVLAALLPKNVVQSGICAAERVAMVNHLQPGTISLRTDGPGWAAESSLGLVGDCVLVLYLRGGL